jgi:RHS repeat-associated protein
MTGTWPLQCDVLHGEIVLSDHLGSPRLRLESQLQAVVDEEGEDPTDVLDWVVAGWAYRNPMDYTPFGRELPLSAEAKTTPEGYTGKPLDLTFGLQAMNYGARFYDPRLGRWWQRDPLDEFTTPYTYCGNSPIQLTDPDGKATYTDADGIVEQITSDLDLSVYANNAMDRDGNYVATKMGETDYNDEFSVGSKIEFGKSWEPLLAEMEEDAERMTHLGVPAVTLALKSKSGAYFDIKNRSDLVPNGPGTGRMLNGKYVTARSAGDYLYGRNVALFTGLSYETMIKAAGGYQKAGLIGALLGAAGKEYGREPYYGEVDYSGRRIVQGWNSVR